MIRDKSNQAIARFTKAGVLLGLILSCSKPPDRNNPIKSGTSDYEGNQPADDKADSVDGGSDGGPDAGVPGADPKIQPLSLDLRRMQPLLFKSLLSKLAYIADADSEKLDANPAFAGLLSNRFNLGDYDYARRSPGHPACGLGQRHHRHRPTNL